MTNDAFSAAELQQQIAAHNAQSHAFPNQGAFTPGMTKRELIAAHALAGLLSHSRACDLELHECARACVAAADELLFELAADK